MMTLGCSFIDYDNGFTGIDLLKWVKFYSLSMCFIVCQCYFNKTILKNCSQTDIFAVL